MSVDSYENFSGTLKQKLFEPKQVRYYLKGQLSIDTTFDPRFDLALTLS